jgi:acetylornithine/succinyldiaminopimelate/putrescine aminotransferase
LVEEMQGAGGCIVGTEEFLAGVDAAAKKVLDLLKLMSR